MKILSELIEQEMLKHLLSSEFKRFNQKHKILCKNEFKRDDAHFAIKPDLVIFHEVQFFHPITRKYVLASPIGIEYKSADGFDNITSGVVIQLQGKYRKAIYEDREAKSRFVCQNLAFTNKTAIRDGLIYPKRHPDSGNFFIERFCWKGDVAVILNRKNKLVFSYRNCYFDFSGKPELITSGDFK